ncbi:hypothetical protein TNCV_989911 [Trichonephila clavipes]|nr:hypothetical protein TNCV_989911 [Trichonephila clavipes]
MNYEVQLQRTLLYYPLAVGEDSLPDSKLVLAENGRGVSDFRLTLYKTSHDSYLRDEQPLLYFTRCTGLSATTFKMLSSRLELRTTLVRQASCPAKWNESVSRS